MYSSNRDVFDNVSASLFGLENANAVPTGDLLRAPISVILKYLIKVTLIFQFSGERLAESGWMFLSQKLFAPQSSLKISAH